MDRSPFLYLLLLFLLGAYIGAAQGAVGESALEKSKHCVQAAREAYDLLANGGADASTTSSVIRHLETLAEDGKYLKRSAESYLSKLESQEEGLDKTLQQFLREKEQLEKEKVAVKQNKASAEKEHSGKQAVLQDIQKQLALSQNELKNADNELQHAKRKLKKKKKKIWGKIKSALGKLVGHVSSAEKKVKSAKKNLERKRSQLNAAQNAANTARQALSNVEVKIQQHDSKIQELQQKVDAKHKEIGSVKGSIVLLRESANFWELFTVAAENAEERATSLKRVIDIVAEVKEYDILQKDGTITKAKSFIEAWGVFTTIHHIE